MRTKKGFTLVEIMIVVAIIGIMAVTMMSNFSGIINKIKRQQIVSDLNVLKKGIIQYKSMYGRWPDDPSEVVNKGLVKWGGKKYSEKLTNKYGFDYNIIREQSGNKIQTVYTTYDGGTAEIYQLFTPPYKASKSVNTIFLNNFDNIVNSDYVADVPYNEKTISATGITSDIGMMNSGTGIKFQTGALKYGCQIPDLQNLTVEFWAKFNTNSPSGSVFNITEDVDADTREIMIYFENISGDPNIVFNLKSIGMDNSSNGSYLANIKFFVDLTAFLAGEEGAEYTDTIEQFGGGKRRWHHFALSYYYDEFKRISDVKIFINGKEQILSDNTLSGLTWPDDFYVPLGMKGYPFSWKPVIFIGCDNNNEYPNLNNVTLDNFSVSSAVKSEIDFIP